MKLVDILAKELKAWPEGVDSVWQSSCDNEIYFDADVRPFYTSLNAEDSGTRGAVITQAQWQAAVDALNAPKVVEWDGDGLPPTGTICELREMSWDADRWETREILYAGSRFLVTTDPDSAGELGSYIWEVQFRPLLTSDKDKEIREMALIPNTSERGIYDVCAALYEAGYRKETKPCGS